MACAATPRPEQGFCLAPTYEKANEVVCEALAAFFESVYGDGVVTYHKTQHVFTLPNGNRVFLRSADNPDRIVGNNYAWAWLDEPGTMKEEVWDRLLGRLRGSEHPVVILTGTPEGLNWVYDKIVKPTEEKRRGYENYRVIYGSSYDNRAHLPDDYFKHMETLPDELKASWINGRFVDFNKLAAYYAFKRELHVVDRLPFNPALPLILAVDFNVDPLSWLLLQDNNGTLQIFDNATLSMPNTRTPEGCELVQMVVNDLNYRGAVQVYGDVSGYHAHTASFSTDYDVINQNLNAELYVYQGEANPPVRDRLTSVNALLAAGRVKISAIGNDALIDDLVRVRLKNGIGTELDKSDLKLTHLSDALGYYVIKKYPITKKFVQSLKY